jgi:phosphoribosyl 1,2-cyclic phosphodiesterase
VITIKFWGVRGSFPTVQASHLGYGGNTTCVEARAGNGVRLIIDAGTGLRELGLQLDRESPSEEIRFLLTHFHADHMHGLPFFKPLYDPARKLTFYSGKRPAEARKALERLMSAPHFPVELGKLQGQRQYVQLDRGSASVDGVQVTSFRLNHPQDAFGFRIEHGGVSVVHASDHEHGVEAAQKELVAAARNADLLIYDAQYTPGEYKTYKGWGHSTWAEAVKAAKQAKVKRLILFHHDPSHDDAALDEIVKQARERFPRTEAAREGMVIEVSA